MVARIWSVIPAAWACHCRDRLRCQREPAPVPAEAASIQLMLSCRAHIVRQPCMLLRLDAGCGHTMLWACCIGAKHRTALHRGSCRRRGPCTLHRRRFYSYVVPLWGIGCETIMAAAARRRIRGSGCGCGCGCSSGCNSADVGAGAQGAGALPVHHTTFCRHNHSLDLPDMLLMQSRSTRPRPTFCLLHVP